MLKVGDEFGSMEELENALLCNIEDIGDIRLSDVADITTIDDAGGNCPPACQSQETDRKETSRPVRAKCRQTVKTR